MLFPTTKHQRKVPVSAGDISLFPLLLNNWTAMLTILLYGCIPFICLPAVPLAANGLLLGVMSLFLQ